MKFYFRALYANEDRWVHQALLDHLSGEWHSPYLAHISNIRGTMKMFTPIPAPSVMKSQCSEYFLSMINNNISSYSWILPLERLARSSYVCEDECSTVITEFKFDCAKLGDKQPRQGYPRKPHCPVCPMNVPNTGIHMLFSCGSLATLRQETGIQSFIVQCQQQGLSLSESFRLYVNGLTSLGKPINRQHYLERGKCMRDMRELWLSKW